MQRLERGPFGLRLLHAVLAEDALTRFDGVLDGSRGHRLGHGGKLDRTRLPAGGFRGEHDLFFHLTEALWNLGGGVAFRAHARYLTGIFGSVAACGNAIRRNLTVSGIWVRLPRRIDVRNG